MSNKPKACFITNNNKPITKHTHAHTYIYTHSPPFDSSTEEKKCLCTFLPLCVKPIICWNSNWNSIYINSSSPNLFMDMADEMMKCTHTWNGKTACTKRWMFFIFCVLSLFHLMPFACTHYHWTNNNKHYELDARKTFLRNKWTSRFIKFMSILTLSISIHPSIHLSHSVDFYWKKKRKEKKIVYKTIYATDMNAHTHNQFTGKKTAKPLKNYFFTYHEFQYCGVIRIWITVCIQQKNEQGEREKTMSKQGKSETLIIKIMA